ncbi:uncharacterized protein LOC128862310, partial [Anastrepha ludens]|uniref:uncharacterized protein LOC128862310 n=1 Tax=Anastrepha ludens TaxID=28586 RepID=UPI0023AF604A
VSSAFFASAYKYVPGISYIDDVQLSYNNGNWQCDRLSCLNKVYGCKISIRNNPSNKDELIRTSKCYLKGDTITQQVSEPQYMAKPKTVAIDIDSYVDAKSLYTTSYSLSYQEVKGTIDPKGWASVQKITRENMKAVDESMGQLKD